MSDTPRTDKFLGKPADEIFAHACQLERENAELREAAECLTELVRINEEGGGLFAKPHAASELVTAMNDARLSLAALKRAKP